MSEIGKKVQCILLSQFSLKRVRGIRKHGSYFASNKVIGGKMFSIELTKFTFS